MAESDIVSCITAVHGKVNCIFDLEKQRKGGYERNGLQPSFLCFSRQKNGQGGDDKTKPMTEGKRNLIQGLLQEYDIEILDDIQDVLKDLLSVPF